MTNFVKEVLIRDIFELHHLSLFILLIQEIN